MLVDDPTEGIDVLDIDTGIRRSPTMAPIGRTPRQEASNGEVNSSSEGAAPEFATPNMEPDDPRRFAGGEPTVWPTDPAQANGGVINSDRSVLDA